MKAPSVTTSGGILLAVCGLLALASSGASLAAPAQAQDDKASVEAFYAAWFGPAQQDPATYASFYASDGFVLPPNARPIQGRDAIADWQRRTRTESPYTIRPEGIRVDEIRLLAPGWAIYRGTLWGQRVPKTGGDPSPFETKYFDVLTRASGEWKVAYRMWSDSRP